MNSWGQAAYVAAGKQVHVNIDPAGVASDVCNAALARKEQYAQELLGIAQRERISGFITDWEDATGNNMTCFNALWGYVSSVLCAQGGLCQLGCLGWGQRRGCALLHLSLHRSC